MGGLAGGTKGAEVVAAAVVSPGSDTELLFNAQSGGELVGFMSNSTGGTARTPGPRALW